jgi:hypothetical protein
MSPLKRSYSSPFHAPISDEVKLAALQVLLSFLAALLLSSALLA